MNARLPRNLRRRSAVHAQFEAAMNSGAPIVDMIGDSRMEYDGPRCDRCGDTPVDDEDVPCVDCLADIGDDQWACPRCPAHWYRHDQTHDEWAARIPTVQAAHLARHDRENGAVT